MAIKKLRAIRMPKSLATNVFVLFRSPFVPEAKMSDLRERAALSKFGIFKRENHILRRSRVFVYPSLLDRVVQKFGVRLDQFWFRDFHVEGGVLSPPQYGSTIVVFEKRG